MAQTAFNNRYMHTRMLRHTHLHTKSFIGHREFPSYWPLEGGAVRTVVSLETGIHGAQTFHGVSIER